MQDEHREIYVSILHDLRLSWRELAITDICYKIIGFVILTPLVGVLFRGCLALSGKPVLADQDILYFFLGPAGWLALIVVGAAWIAVAALEQAALMTIVYGARKDTRLRVLPVLYFIARKTWPILRVTTRLVLFSLLLAAPFLAAGGAVFLTLLTEFDINYYLAEKPPKFWMAVLLIGPILAVLVFLLVRVWTRWIFALPLLLFEDTEPSATLRASVERTKGHLRRILLWCVAWFLAAAILSAISTALVGIVGRWIIPMASTSLPLLVLSVGATLVLWSGVNLVVTLFSATTFATMLTNLYHHLGSPEGVDLSSQISAKSRDASGVLSLSPRKLFLAASAAVLLAAAAGAAFMNSVKLDDEVEITAHRGASAAAPENSLASVKLAIEDGTDWVEIDVQESADGVVLVVHDADLMKIANVNLKIWEATAEELRKVDIGTPVGAEFKGESIPTLEEVLLTCKGKVGLNIELKYYGHDQQLEQRVVDLVEAHEMESDVVIMSLKYDGIQKIRALRPDWKIGLLSAVALGDLTKLDADFLAVNVGLATRSFVRSAHGSNKEVYAWTVNDPITMSAMIGRGVDSLITDKPALVRTVLAERAEMSSLERLFVELALFFGVKTDAKTDVEDA